MISGIQKFWKLFRLGGIKLAVLRTVEHIKRNIYSKIGVSEYIQSRLLIGGPAMPLHALYLLLHRRLISLSTLDQIDVMEEDWDNLILLDSYRADYFSEYSSFSGDLSTRISKGTWSLEFIVNNFQDKTLHDTVVVTSNPYYQRYSKLGQDTFHSIQYCEKTIGIESFKQVSQLALEASEEFPNKRLIIHYMKPHTPHIGETSDKYRAKFGDIFPGMFMLYRSGVITKNTLEQSYVDTINMIEPEVQDLLDKLDGKSVVSSDHGENLGERYHGVTQTGHGSPTPECYRVPWLEMEHETRRQISEDPPEKISAVDEESVENNLRALGYK